MTLQREQNASALKHPCIACILSTLTFATFVLEVVVARFNSWDHFFLTLGSEVRFRSKH